MMRTELKLVPDGGTEVPAEAKDHGILASYLESNASVSSSSPIESWRDVERVVRGSGEAVILRVPGGKSDYTSATLDAIETALTSNISGLKAHPDGWQEFGE